ncbi:hypothetical protein DLAC_09587 [Tieghemostelium lacteum]|uniref:Transmembrane protein n=1 Tax=Tieghemostelium lacteum TaxID=361077 RepID=A0A151Z6P1_TIELA|nr:hypothetical protein DLAC_09587 [Tieghemostelium lacteum]|eukprot:KYQ89623.1 hypothetical protein DLAC_09587 [Tieghemostelium lacteum]
MNKLFVLLLFVLLQQIVLASKNGVSPSKLTTFVWSASCGTEAGCDITQANSWNDTTAIGNSSEYIFQVDVSGQAGIINLMIASAFAPGQLYISGTSNTTLTINENTNIDQLCTFENVQVNADGVQFVFGMLNTMGETILVFKGDSIVYSSDVQPQKKKSTDIKPKASPTTPVISVNVNSTMNFQDSAQLFTSNIEILGTVNLISQTLLQASIVNIQSNFYISPSASMACDQLTVSVTEGSPTLLIMGNMTVNQLFQVMDHTQISVNNLNVPSIYIDSTSSLTIENGTSEISSLVMLGNLNIVDSTFVLASQNQLVLSQKGLLSISGKSAVTLSNVVLTNNLQMTDNATLFIENNVYFMTYFYLHGIVYVNEGASLFVTQALDVEECIFNSGTVVLHSTLACYQNKFQNSVAGSQLTLMDQSVIYAVELWNYGTVQVESPSVLHANLLNYGTITIGVDKNFKVTGYCDFYDNSLLMIQGIGYNTDYSAFDVTNIITLTGELYFNISDPPTTKGTFTYYLIHSDLYTDNNFTQITPDPSLDDYGIKLTYLATQGTQEVTDIEIIFSNGVVETSSEIEESEEHKEKEKKELSIAFGIIVPLVVLALVIGGLYIIVKRRNRRSFALYEKIADGDL